jgi:hypothetical protein
VIDLFKKPLYKPPSFWRADERMGRAAGAKVLEKEIQKISTKKGQEKARKTREHETSSNGNVVGEAAFTPGVI